MRHGKADPVTGKEIANQIGLKPRSTGKEGADMRSVLNALRTKGYPICADGKGYWWPRDDHELSAYITSFQGRIDDQQKACDGLKKGFDKIGKSPIAVKPQKKVPVSFNDVAHLIPEHEVQSFIDAHPGAQRL